MTFFPPIVDNSRRQRRRISGGVKTRLLQRHFAADPHCRYCGVLTVRAETSGSISDNTATLEHKKPRVFGGEDTYDNTTLACHRCNKEAGTAIGFLAANILYHNAAPNRLFGTIIVNGEAV